jgi:dihydroxyacetone kinase-like protein
MDEARQTGGDGKVQFDTERKKMLISAVADSIIAHVDELTALDQAIGDGDHGYNMKRGFEAVLADAGVLSAKPLPDFLRGIGMKLVSTVGGASGPLYGTLFMALGKELSAEPSRHEAVSAFGAAILAVKARGKSDAGQKTMLDVLVPTHEAMAQGAEATAIKKAAAQAASATVPMRATRGRASFLGERSIGHMDPGARSSSLMIAALCDLFGES